MLHAALIKNLSDCLTPAKRFPNAPPGSYLWLRLKYITHRNIYFEATRSGMPVNLIFPALPPSFGRMM